MRIVMMTNTYLPHVGGVARSVETFTEEYRRRGHEVLVVAPEFPDMPEREEGVIRVPAIQQFNGSDFSVRIPIPGFLAPAIADFEPDIVHSHHPFLLGDTALRIATLRNIPLVFTHHTMYERYTHYVPGDSPAMRRFVIELATHYANLCDRVIAPSESIASILRRRGVETPIAVVPTGVDIARYAKGHGGRARRKWNIPPEAFVIGHVGRLAPEKNLTLLAKSVILALKRNPTAWFLVVGSGPSAEEIETLFHRARLSSRLKMVGSQQGQDLVDAYHAMDVFAFASTSETQGMVLVEAMAAAAPVVAIDAPGAREVVVDQVNGRLLPNADSKGFAEAVGWVANHRDKAKLDRMATATAEEFSTDRCVEKALALYESATGVDRGQQPREEVANLYPWESILNLIEKEYRLWENRASAASMAMQGEFLVKMPFVRWIRRYWRRAARALSRNEWATNLLQLPRSHGTEITPGLVMIQIDGLAQTELLRALDHRSMPYLKRLLEREGYKLHTLYSGLPSSTPAVQGELFYGVRGAVPGFSFRDHGSSDIVRMLDQQAALEVQKRLATVGEGLLQDGSAYGNIYSGGAAEPHFCSVTLGWGNFLRAANPFTLAAFFLMHFPSMLRVAGLLAIELVLAIVDFFRGLLAGHSFWNELKFIPTRVGVCVLLRELILIGTSIDVTRGLPVVHCNLIGYDEQAHRRGPASAFAHWSLRGIDKTIERIAKAAHQSRHRDYVVWIYADHGQEEVVSYVRLTGNTIDQAVVDILEPHLNELGWDAPGESPSHDTIHGKEHQRSDFILPPSSFRLPSETIHSEEHQRSQWLGPGPLGTLQLHGERRTPGGNRLAVAAMGPLGQIYLPPLPFPLGEERLSQMAHDLIHQGQIPTVVARHDGKVLAWNSTGRFELPCDAARVFGEDHPFLEEVTRDFLALLEHPDAGELVICGWNPTGRSVSFPRERGAHAGPGIEETRAFALLPSEVRIDKEYLRPEDLRKLAFEILHPRYRLPAEQRQPRIQLREPAPRERPASLPRPVLQPLRILTYNVHSCIGLDGKLSPRRIARVIARCGADIVALQEVDVGRRTSGRYDQAHLIAHELEMEHHFHAAWEVEEERYGNAILSRYPLELIHAGVLPTVTRRKHVESRGAILVEVDLGGTSLHLVNTHLGLLRQERELQVEALLGAEWLGRGTCDGPRILCGDFNMPPGSSTYKRICTTLHDTQLLVTQRRPKSTWPGNYPWRRLDYVFVSEEIEAAKVEVLRSQLTRVASDHLPLLTELRLGRAAHASRSSPPTEVISD